MKYYRVALKKTNTIWYGWDPKLDNFYETGNAWYIEDETKSSLSEWKDTGYVDERAIDAACGVHHTYSDVTYRFVGVGAKILRKLLQRFGRAAKAILYVETFNASTRQYEFNYSSDLNFAKCRPQRYIVDIEAKDKSIESKLKNREDIVYEFPVSGANMKRVRLKPFRVKGEATFMTEWPVPDNPGNLEDVERFMLYCLFVDKQVEQLMDAFGTDPLTYAPPENNDNITGQRFINGNPNFFDVDNYLFKANTDLKNVRIAASINFYAANNTGTNGRFHLSIYLRDPVTGNYQNGAGVPLYRVYSPIINDGTDLSFLLNVDTPSFEIPSGWTLVIHCDMENSVADDFNCAWVKDREIKVYFEHFVTITSTLMDCMPVDEICKQMVNKITDGEGVFASNLLTSVNNYADDYDLRYSNLMLLPGNSVRGIANSVIKLSLNQLKQFLFVCCGGCDLGVEGNVVRFEKAEYYFKNTPADQILQINEVADLDYRTDYEINEIQVGFEMQEYESLNGKEEPHCKHIYRTQLNNGQRKLDLVSPVRADGFGMYKIRLDYILDPKQDTKDDDDVFVVQVKTAPEPNTNIYPALYPDGIVATPTVTGMTDTNLLNPGLTPKKCLLRLGRYLRSFFYGPIEENSYLVFQTSERNSELTTKITTLNTIVEKANVAIINLGAPLFLPFVIETESVTPVSYHTATQGKLNGYLSIHWQGKIYHGFIRKVSSRNVKPQVKTMELMATPSNDPNNWD